VLTYDLITPGCTDNFTLDDCNFIFTIEPDVLTDEFVIPADSYNNLTVFNSLRNIRMKYAQNVIVSHINVNSLRKKFDEIKFILDNGYIDIMCIAETKLDVSDSSNIFNVNEFTMFRRDKRKNSGGLMILINERIACRQIFLDECSINPEVEIITIEITLGKEDKWLLCYIYKNPKVTDNDFMSQFSTLFDSVASIYDNYMYIGDLNMNYLNPRNRIHDLCATHDLYNLIKTPTCQKGAVGTLLDLILVPHCEKQRFFKGYSEDIGLSDFHSMVIAPMRKALPTKMQEFSYYRKVNNIDYDSVKIELLELQLDQNAVLCENAEEAFSVLHKSICTLFEKHAPLIKRRIDKKSFPIMNSKLKNSIIYRNRQRNKYYKTRTTSHYALYKVARNNVTKAKRDLLRSYFLKKCKGGTSNKHFWNTIKPFVSHKMKSRNNIILREEDNIVTDPSRICNIFCDFFSNIGSDNNSDQEILDKPLFSIIFDYLNHPSLRKINANFKPINTFSLNKVNIPQVKNVIKNLKSKKAAGYDEIPPIFIKKLKNDLAETLVILFNRCIDECVFPQCLKKANISPIYKKKDRLNKDNYRSINILPIISKIFERLVADQFEIYCMKFFHPILSGFRKNYGCSDLLNKLLSDWKISLDKNEVISIDLSKAFDCLPIGLLLAKLYAYGFDYNTCLFMKSYLSSRKQRVKIGNHHSPWACPSRGVPQGSILGPALFNIFLNDLLYCKMYSSIYNYADDNTLSMSSSNLDEIIRKLGHDVENICDWFNENMMKANPEKFQVMFLGARVNSTDVDITFKDTKITGEQSITILGVEFDDKLNFNTHINTICKKISQQINATMRIKSNLDKESRLAIYNAFILSNLNYCNNIWFFANKSGLTILDKANERAIRMIYDDKKTPYDMLLKQKGHLDAFRICYKGICTTMYKIWNGIAPSYLSELFVVNESVYNLRDNQTYTLPKYRNKTHGYHSLPYIGAKAWSKLDTKVKQSSSLVSFKKSIKSYVLNKSKITIVNDYF